MTAHSPQTLSRWAATCLTLAAIALGAAVQVRDGLVAPAAIAWLTFAIFTAFAAFIHLPETSRLKTNVSRHFELILSIGLLLQFAQHLAYRPPAIWRGGNSTTPYYLLLSIAAACSTVVIVKPRRAKVAFWCALLTFAALGIWLLTSAPKPRMDVWSAQTAGLDAALHGHDPWSTSFRDLYGKPDLYAPGTVKDGRTHLGFPYPPVSFFLDLPGYLLGGDYRWSNLAAMLLAAILIARLTDGPASKLVALIFLFTPRALLVLRNGWTEPQIAMLLAATIFTATRRPRWTPYILGLLLASKQYMFIAIAPALLLLPNEDRPKWIAKVVAAALLVSLPLILWNLPAYLRANFAAASGAAFRYDAMSYFAYWADTHAWTPPSWIGWVCLLAAVPVTALALKHSPHTPQGFTAALSVVMIVFFALNKFAFCNYYYLVIAAFCTAAAPRSRELARASIPIENTREQPRRHAKTAA